MKLLEKLFRKRVKNHVRPLPSWETIVKMMCDAQLNMFSDEIVRVIYSKDMSMRYVVLRNDRGLLSYQLEKIFPLDEEEWCYFGSNDHALPAMWLSAAGHTGKSVFESTEELMREMKSEPEYLNYFE